MLARTLCLAAFALLDLHNDALAGTWPPTLDSSNTTTQTKDGRTVERYTHGPRDTWGWGYADEAAYDPVPGPATRRHIAPPMAR